MRSSFPPRQALLVAIIVILSSFGVGLARLAWTDYNLRVLEAAEQARVDALTQAIGNLDKQIALAKTDDYVRVWARQTAKLTQTGEVPVVLVLPDKVEPSASDDAPKARPSADEIPRWQMLLERLWPMRNAP